jgi:hypothetical protein
MKIEWPFEIAKTIGFFGLGYWSWQAYHNWFFTLFCCLMGSAIVSIAYRLSERNDNV